jgi:hypothetical protein
VGAGEVGGAGEIIYLYLFTIIALLLKNIFKNNSL